MSNASLESTLTELGVPGYIEEARETSLARMIAFSQTSDTDQPSPEKLPRYAFLHESQGIAAYHQSTTDKSKDLSDVRFHFSESFACWRALCTLSNGNGVPSPREVSKKGIQLIKAEFENELVSPELTLSFHLAVTGLVAERTAETRLELLRFSLPPPTNIGIWRNHVAVHVLSAFVLLVRKHDGWTDIDSALHSINTLRELQKDYEETYIGEQDGDDEQTLSAIELIGLYHLAQLITITGEYLRDGITPITQISIRIDRHHDRADSAFRAAEQPILVHIADLLWVGCRELTQNSIWTHVNGLGEHAQRFARLLTERGRPNPVIELWPSQQRALKMNLLDPYRRAVLVEMPTSAGKTLLAKFAIVQTKALNPNGTIAYIVPTRALVNQITLDLRADFGDFGYSVEQAVPAFELDPTEERLLENPPDVLVATPEKFDLLIRRDHRATKDLSLVIADEAHNIREGGRGARLELLLGTIKRDRAGARFLLLSPFLPNDEELVLWLGDDRALDPISVNWKPSRKIVGSVDIRSKQKNRYVIFTTLPAADNSDVREDLDIVVGLARDSEARTISGITRATVRSMIDRGAILVLCRGQGTAMNRAKELANDMPELPQSSFRDSVCRYVEAEVGGSTGLVQHLKRGVSYHHAGLSNETRWLIESLIRRGDVKVICGTTTLAQGMNFPIATAVVETLKKGDVDLTYQDFWNIAGRAGRTLVDTVGVVAFPSPSRAKRVSYEGFLKQEALEISSQLATLIDRADEIAEKFNDTATLRNLPELSALMQFLAHAMRVSGSSNVADEVEDLLRASLVFHQAQRQGKRAANRLVQLCRAYLEQIRGRGGILTLADQTGFTTPSVLRLISQRNVTPGLSSMEAWQPRRLFSDDIGPLTDRIQMIAALPEMQLGAGQNPPFSPERVAAILRDWVRGDTLTSLTKKYPISSGDVDRQVADFTRYLFSTLLGRASWGIGALEAICLAGQDSQTWDEAGYVPSMIFFGVQRKEAIWLRMVGMPRVVANGLGALWQQTQTDEPSDYQHIRKWVDDLSDQQWRQAIPAETSLSPSDMRLIWREFSGTPSTLPLPSNGKN